MRTAHFLCYLYCESVQIRETRRAILGTQTGNLGKLMDSHPIPSRLLGIVFVHLCNISGDKNSQIGDEQPLKVK